MTLYNVLLQLPFASVSQEQSMHVKSMDPSLKSKWCQHTCVDTALANTVYAMHASYNSSLQTTPGALVFHQDMLMNLLFIADLQLISEHQQQLIDA
jgi:hypothetical protein